MWVLRRLLCLLACLALALPVQAMEPVADRVAAIFDASALCRAGSDAPPGDRHLSGHHCILCTASLQPTAMPPVTRPGPVPGDALARPLHPGAPLSRPVIAMARGPPVSPAA